MEELNGRGCSTYQFYQTAKVRNGISDDAPVRGEERIVISRTRGMLMQVQLCGYGGNLGFGRRRPKGMLLKIKGDPQRTLGGWDREDCDVVMTIEVRGLLCGG